MKAQDPKIMANDLRTLADLVERGDVDKVMAVYSTVEENHDSENSCVVVITAGMDRMSAVGMLNVVSSKLAAA